MRPVFVLVLLLAAVGALAWMFLQEGQPGPVVDLPGDDPGPRSERRDGDDGALPPPVAPKAVDVLGRSPLPPGPERVQDWRAEVITIPADEPFTGAMFLDAVSRRDMAIRFETAEDMEAFRRTRLLDPHPEAMEHGPSVIEERIREEGYDIDDRGTYLVLHRRDAGEGDR